MKLNTTYVYYNQYFDIIYTVEKAKDFLFSAWFNKDVYCYHLNGVIQKDFTYYEVDYKTDVKLGEL